MRQQYQHIARHRLQDGRRSAVSLGLYRRMGLGHGLRWDAIKNKVDRAVDRKIRLLVQVGVCSHVDALGLGLAAGHDDDVVMDDGDVGAGGMDDDLDVMDAETSMRPAISYPTWVAAWLLDAWFPTTIRATATTAPEAFSEARALALLARPPLPDEDCRAQPARDKLLVEGNDAFLAAQESSYMGRQESRGQHHALRMADVERKEAQERLNAARAEAAVERTRREAREQAKMEADVVTKKLELVAARTERIRAETERIRAETEKTLAVQQEVQGQVQPPPPIERPVPLLSPVPQAQPHVAEPQQQAAETQPQATPVASPAAGPAQVSREVTSGQQHSVHTAPPSRQPAGTAGRDTHRRSPAIHQASTPRDVVPDVRGPLHAYVEDDAPEVTDGRYQRDELPHQPGTAQMRQPVHVPLTPPTTGRAVRMMTPGRSPSHRRHTRGPSLLHQGFSFTTTTTTSSSFRQPAVRRLSLVGSPRRSTNPSTQSSGEQQEQVTASLARQLGDLHAGYQQSLGRGRVAAADSDGEQLVANLRRMAHCAQEVAASVRAARLEAVGAVDPRMLVW